VSDSNLTFALAHYDHLKPLTTWEFPFGFFEILSDGVENWLQGPSVRPTKRDFCVTKTLFGIGLDNERQKKIRILFDPEYTCFCYRKSSERSTVILKKTLFKTSYKPGTNISIDFHEALVFCVLNHDNNEVFKTESIMVMIEYKYSKMKRLN